MSRSRRTTYATAPIGVTSYLIAVVMAARSLTIYVIFVYHLKCKYLTLKIKVKVMKEKNVNLRYATGDVQLHIANCLTILIFGKLRLRQLGHTYTHSGTWAVAKGENEQYIQICLNTRTVEKPLRNALLISRF